MTDAKDNIVEWTPCEECGSTFIAGTSSMASLCPECAHHLYGYKNCPHSFEGPRCTRCGWDGARSTYIRTLLAR